MNINDQSFDSYRSVTIEKQRRVTHSIVIDIRDQSLTPLAQCVQTPNASLYIFIHTSAKSYFLSFQQFYRLMIPLTPKLWIHRHDATHDCQTYIRRVSIADFWPFWPNYLDDFLWQVKKFEILDWAGSVPPQEPFDQPGLISNNSKGYQPGMYRVQRYILIQASLLAIPNLKHCTSYAFPRRARHT